MSMIRSIYMWYPARFIYQWSIYLGNCQNHCHIWFMPYVIPFIPPMRHGLPGPFSNPIQPKYIKSRFPNPCHLKLREYTVQFGRCLVDLYDKLVATPCGMPSLPSSGVPPAKESFQALPESGFDLGYAQLEQVYNHVSRGKNLVIPAEWRHLIPNPPWWTATAFNLGWDQYRVPGCLSIMGIPKRSWRGKGLIEAHNHEIV